MYTILQLFGLTHILDEVNGNNIHRVENILTLCLHHHKQFDLLGLWLEATGSEKQDTTDYRYDSGFAMQPKGCKRCQMLHSDIISL